jgi:hypothetical protein
MKVNDPSGWRLRLAAEVVRLQQSKRSCREFRYRTGHYPEGFDAQMLASFTGHKKIVEAEVSEMVRRKIDCSDYSDGMWLLRL